MPGEPYDLDEITEQLDIGGEGGKHHGEGQIDEPESVAGLPDGCPLIPVGHRDGVYWFLSEAGELRRVEGRGMNEAGLDALFDGATTWLFENYRAVNKEGAVVGFNHRRARPALMRACRRAGLFDPMTPVRGRGVWSDGNAGLLVHCGDRILIDGEWRPAGLLRDGAIFPACARIPPPAVAPAEADVGAALGEAFGLWSFREAIGPDALVGFVAQAFLGAAPDWRGHVYTLAEHGSGKTWLAELLAAALGGAAHPLQNNFTEAGIRQALTGEARALILDEAEHDEGGGRIKAVIETIRHMSGAAGARVVRGTAGGIAQGFTLAGPVYLSAVLAGALKPQDRSRMTMLHLNSLPAGPGTAKQRELVRAATRRCRVESPALWARALAGWERWIETLAAWRESFLAAGLSPRAADQLSVFPAGRDLLCTDALPEPGAISDEVETWLVLSGLEAGDDLEGEGIECLQHLMSAPLDLWRSGEQRTVAGLLLEAVREGGVEARRGLQVLGLRYDHVSDAERRELMVANRQVGLERLFRDTRWAGQGWPDALRHLEGVEACKQPVRFVGVRSRATVIPGRYFPVDETSAASSPHEV